MKTKNATVRLPEEVADYLSSRYDSVSYGVYKVVEELRQIRAQSTLELKGVFTQDEWKFFADSLNGTMVDGVFRTNVGALIAHVEDSERFEGSLTRWGISLDDLVSKIKTLKGANIEAIYTKVEDFRKNPKDLDGFSKW